MARPKTPPAPPTAQQLRLLSGCLALAVLLVFANCLLNTFVWDDEQFIVKNAFLTSPSFLPKLLTSNVVAGAGLVSNLYRPLPSLTHFLDVQLWGYRPWAHHLSTVLYHAAASVAVFRLLASLAPAWPAAIATALFSLHPMQSEAVAYACGRVDSLAILFICLGLLSSERHRWLSLLFAALAMATKEHAALFPAFLFLYDRAAKRPSTFRRHLPFWLLSGAYVVARLTVLNFQNTLNFYNQPNLLTEHPLLRLYTYLTTLPKGLWLWVWPTDLHHERSWSVATSFGLPQVWGSALLVAGLLGLAVWSWRRGRRLAAVGIAWFFVATLPTSNLLVLINALFYDHWFLLPGLGLAMVVAEAVAVWLDGPVFLRRATAAVSLTAVMALSAMTLHDNALWRTPLTLYRYILSREPTSAKIHNNLAMAYADDGDFREAIRFYREAIRLDDEFPQTHHNLANAYLALSDEGRALEEFRRAVAMDPRFYHSWVGLGAIALKRHQPDAARDAFERALRAYPYATEAYLGLAQVHLAQGDRRAALAVLQAGLSAQPHHPRLQAALERLLTRPPHPPPPR